MNYAEQRRNVRIAAMDDLELLKVVAVRDGDVTDSEFVAFANIRTRLRGGAFMSKKERAWAEEVARRITPLRSSEVPKGREVALAPVLRNLPKRPPLRKVVDNE